MKRALRVSLIAAVAAVGLYGRPADARVNVDINVGVPPPPAVYFNSRPEVVVVPHTRVYYAPEVSDYDMYQYGPYWYINQNGYWYRSSNYGGPFASVEYGRVPHSIVVLPTHYRHHPLRPVGYERHHRRGHHYRHHHGRW